METIISIFLATLIKNGALTSLSVSLGSFIYMIYIHKTVLKNIPEDHTRASNVLDKLLKHQGTIQAQQQENSKALILHTKESSDNASNIGRVKEDVREIKGMLSIMGLNTSRGIK